MTKIFTIIPKRIEDKVSNDRLLINFKNYDYKDTIIKEVTENDLINDLLSLGGNIYRNIPENILYIEESKNAFEYNETLSNPFSYKVIFNHYKNYRDYVIEYIQKYGLPECGTEFYDRLDFIYGDEDSFFEQKIDITNLITRSLTIYLLYIIETDNKADSFLKNGKNCNLPDINLIHKILIKMASINESYNNACMYDSSSFKIINPFNLSYPNNKDTYITNILRATWDIYLSISKITDKKIICCKGCEKFKTKDEMATYKICKICIEKEREKQTIEINEEINKKGKELKEEKITQKEYDDEIKKLKLKRDYSIDSEISKTILGRIRERDFRQKKSK